MKFLTSNRFLSIIVAGVIILGAWGILIVANNWDGPGRKAYHRYYGTIAEYSAEVQQNLYYSGEEDRYVILDNTGTGKYSKIHGHFVQEEGGDSYWSSIFIWRRGEERYAVVWFVGTTNERVHTSWADGTSPTKEESAEILRLLQNTVESVMTDEHLEKKDGPVIHI